MFWYLLLAHLIADYPFQNSWMVRNKGDLRVLFLHALIHFVTMLAAVWTVISQVWLILLAIAVIHFFVDLGKNILRNYRPHWVAWPYIIDQAIHILVIFLAANDWIQPSLSQQIPYSQNIAIYATAYLFASFVWYISERILTNSIPFYQQQVMKQVFTRMLARVLMLTAFLVSWNLFRTPPVLGWLAIPGIAATVHLPYSEEKTRTRAIITDIIVSSVSAVMVLVAA